MKTKNKFEGAFVILATLAWATLFIVSFCYSDDARSADLEIDVGRSLYVNGHDDFWYQEAFEHKLNYRGTTFEIGAHDNLWQSGDFAIDYGVAWNYLGHMHMQSYAVPDNHYSIARHNCIADCLAQTDFFGSGHDQGFTLTLEPTYKIAGFVIGAQIGPYLHRNTFSESLQGCSNAEVKDNFGWTLGKMAGIFISHDAFTFKYQYFVNADHFAGVNVNTQDFPAAWHGTHVISIGYRF